MNESERIRSMLDVSRSEFSRRYNIPIRTLEDWDSGRTNPPAYVTQLLERVVKEDKLKELFEEKNRLQKEIEEINKLRGE